MKSCQSKMATGEDEPSESESVKDISNTSAVRTRHLKHWFAETVNRQDLVLQHTNEMFHKDIIYLNRIIGEQSDKNDILKENNGLWQTKS